MGNKVQMFVEANTQKAEANILKFNNAVGMTESEFKALQTSMASPEFERFNTRLNRNAQAAEYFGGKTESLTRKQSMLRREMERLIRRGSSDSAYFKKLEKSYKDVSKEIDATAKKQNSFSSFMQRINSSGVTGILPFVGIAGAVTAVATELDAATEAATKAESELAKYNITYSELGEEAVASVEQLADKYDMAESSVQGMLGSVGDLLSGFGATQEQSLELASSASNLGGALARMSPHLGTAADATDDLAKAALGERDALKKWGVVISEALVQSKLFEKGQDDLLGTELQLAKAAATLEIAYSQSNNALKNAESGTVNAAIANQMWAEALKESRELTGQWINDFATPFKVQMAEILQSINENRKAYNEFKDTLDSGKSMDDLIASGNESAITNIRAMINEFAGLTGIGNGMYPEADAENMVILVKRVSEEFNVSKAQVLELTEQMGYATEEAETILSETIKSEEAAKKHAKEVEAMAEGYRAMAKAYTEGMEEARIEMEKNREEQDKMNLSASKYKSNITEIYARKLEDLGISGEIEKLELERTRTIKDQREAAEKSHILEKNFNENVLPSINAYYDALVDKTKEKLALEEDEETLLESLIGDEKARVKEIEDAQAALVELTKLQEKAFVQGDSSMVELLGEVEEALMDIINADKESPEANPFWEAFDEQFQLGARKSALEAGDVMSAIVVDPATLLINIAMSLAETMSEAAYVMGEAVRYSDWEGVSEDMAEMFMDAFTDNMGPVGAFLDGLFGAAADQDVEATERELAKVLRDLDDAADKEAELQELRLQNLEELVEQEKEAMNDLLEEINNRYSTEFSILQDAFDRNLISANDFRTQSSTLFAQQQAEEAAAEAPYNDAVQEQEDYETQIAEEEQAQEDHLNKVRNKALAELLEDKIDYQKKLNKMSWWEKTFTNKDEKLEAKIDNISDLISLVKSADSVDEINELTDSNYPTVPKESSPSGVFQTGSISMAAEGADFITNGPRLLLVGENAGGREHVSVTPLSSPNINGPLNNPSNHSQTINLNLNGPIVGIEDLTRQVETARKRLVSRGIISA